LKGEGENALTPALFQWERERVEGNVVEALEFTLTPTLSHQGRGDV
jgi:hypothetical protein